MYKASLDSVRELTSLPRMDPGAPCPTILAQENSLLLGYFLQERQQDHGLEPPCLLVRFQRPYAHYLGAPNEEAISGHPLAERGVTPCAAFEISESSWLQDLERMNSVHPYHDLRQYSQFRHFIFVFHDSTFECIAESFETFERRGEIGDALRELSARA